METEGTSLGAMPGPRLVLGLGRSFGRRLRLWLRVCPRVLLGFSQDVPRVLSGCPRTFPGSSGDLS